MKIQDLVTLTKNEIKNLDENFYISFNNKERSKIMFDVFYFADDSVNFDENLVASFYYDKVRKQSKVTLEKGYYNLKENIKVAFTKIATDFTK